MIKEVTITVGSILSVFILFLIIWVSSISKQLNCVENEQRNYLIAIAPTSSDIIGTYNDTRAYMRDRTKIPFQKTFVAVSIIESGWDYSSYGGTIDNNIFGMNNSKFTTKVEAIKFLETWVNLNPPTKEEIADSTGFSFLIRRGYNPYIQVYYPKLVEIRSKI